MNDQDQECMREWARSNGKSVRQKTVRQETTKYKAGTLPLNMYKGKQPIGEKVQFETPSINGLNQNNKNSSEHLDENRMDLKDEYSEGSDSSDLGIDDNDGRENSLSFLRTTRSGRSITINRSLFKWNVRFHCPDDSYFLSSWFHKSFLVFHEG